MVSLEIRDVHGDEIDDVVRIHNQVVSASDREYTIYSSPRVAMYLRAIVAWPILSPQHRIIGAWNGQELVAYAHYRDLGCSYHLNHIAVADRWQGSGIGNRLFQHWEAEARSRNYTKLSLDVSINNTRAREWYIRRGFESDYSTYVFSREHDAIEASNDGNCTSGLRIQGWEAAEAWQRAFGFSTFGIHEDDRRWSVGRLWTKYFQLDAVPSEEAWHVLKVIDSKRDVLIRMRAGTIILSNDDSLRLTVTRMMRSE